MHTFPGFYRLLLILLFVVAVAGTLHAQNIPIAINVRADKNNIPISPTIYGINAYVFYPEWAGPSDWKVGLANVESDLNLGSRRLGGNTMTSYNWVNGFSNSGHDDANSNNDAQSTITGAGDAPYAPGAALKTFHDQSLQLGTYSLLQLPCAGYVAADNNGPVSAGEAAPSARWKPISFAKPGAPGSYTLTPNPNDNTVYIDEELNYLTSMYGLAGIPIKQAIPAFELDNEPGDWHTYPDENGITGTHPLLHAAETTCQDVLDRNIALAKMIKSMDPNAEVYGPAMFGYPEYATLWSEFVNNTLHLPADWNNFNVEPYTTNQSGDPYRYNHMTWLNAYLAKMSEASQAAGKRLLDVLSLHYYSEDAGDAASRIQAPRSLWDDTYVENSYITQNGVGLTDGRAIQLIPKLQHSITDFYAGTRLAFTEWDFYGRHEISGAIAQADVLGIFGKYAVYAANYFDPVDDYIAAAFKIYRNYDGANSRFGDTSAYCTTSDIVNNSAYASTGGPGMLHVVYINKSLTNDEDATMTISGIAGLNHVAIYSVGSANSTITKTADMAFSGSTLTYTFPKGSVSHVVFSGNSGVRPPNATVSKLHLSENPCTISTTLSGQTSTPSALSVTIYDALGRTVSRYHAGTLVGPFSITLDVHELPVGMYNVAASLGGKSEVEKLVVAR